jgi:hypothetical protein
MLHGLDFCAGFLVYRWSGSLIDRIIAFLGCFALRRFGCLKVPDSCRPTLVGCSLWFDNNSIQKISIGSILSPSLDAPYGSHQSMPPLARLSITLDL